jgi:hypothetical protein
MPSPACLTLRLEWKEFPAVVVTLVGGSGGAAVTRTSDGRWSSESTGTDHDLNGITSVVRTTAAASERYEAA